MTRNGANEVSVHAFSRCWLHMIWATLDRRQMLGPLARARLAGYFDDYTQGKGLFLRARHANADHVHVLVDLPTNMAIENLCQLLKGSSSHWINEQQLCPGRFAWQRGYGVFSVSHSHVERVVQYIDGQEAHHHRATFEEEHRRFAQAYGLKWRDEHTGMAMEDGPGWETVETVREWESDDGGHRPEGRC